MMSLVGSTRDVAAPLGKGVRIVLKAAVGRAPHRYSVHSAEAIQIRS